MKRRAWLACVAMCACVASESGNSAPRCDEPEECELDQICYRGFCVDDGTQQVDPSTGAEDASQSVTPVLDATSDASDASQPSSDPSSDAGRDAGLQDAAVQDAAVPDAAVRDAAVRDAAVRDAGKPRPDAGMCIEVCKPGKVSNECKKCLQNIFGGESSQLCDDDDAADNPLCIALCLGAASKAPSCAADKPCSGLKCGGKP